MVRILITLLLMAISCVVQAADLNPKLQALIITGQNGHDWRGTTPLLRMMLEETGRFEVRVTEDSAALDRTPWPLTIWSS